MDRLHMSWAWAAGGMVSNVHDLCRWAGVLFGGELLTAEALEEMTHPTPLSVERGEPYGLGIYVKERGGGRALGHTGSTMGFRGELFFDPGSGICVAVLTNDFLAKPLVIADEVWALLRERPPGVASE